MHALLRMSDAEIGGLDVRIGEKVEAGVLERDSPI
jgi:hypothetical protein